jgi:hypothetical protein
MARARRIVDAETAGCGRILLRAILSSFWPFEIGFVLGLFFWGWKVVHFHNPFVKKRLRSFWAFNEIGFVYSD